MDCPINSTRVDTSAAAGSGSHHDLELSMIRPAVTANRPTSGQAEVHPPTPSHAEVHQATSSQAEVHQNAPDQAGDVLGETVDDQRTSLQAEDMVLTGLNGSAQPSGLFKCHCGKECTR